MTPDQPTGEAERAPLALRRTCLRRAQARQARLIRKIYEVDPLLCSRCGATMKVIAVIEDEEVIYHILSHLKLLSTGDGRSAELATKPTGPAQERPSLPVRRTQTGELAWPDPA